MVQEAKVPFFNMLIWCGRDLICQKTGNLSKTENKRLDLVESGELQINVSVISVVTLRLEENNRVWGQLILLEFEKNGVYPTYTHTHIHGCGHRYWWRIEDLRDWCCRSV